MFGNMNRAVPSVHNPNVVASDANPIPKDEPSTMLTSALRRP